MKEMIKKYRGSLICSVLVMLIGGLVGFTSTQSMWVNVFFVVTDCWGGSKLKKAAPQSCGSSLQICNPFVAAPLFDKRRTLRGVRERSGARRRKPFMKKLRRR